MPDETDIIISELTNAPQIDDTAVFPLTQDNAGEPATFKASMSEIAGKVAEGTTFVNLETTAKNLVGAINEVVQGGGGGTSDIISTASGTIATFNDGGDNIPVKSLVTGITATQAGTGTPSPDNIRAITGVDTVNVYVMGKNFLPMFASTTSSGINYTVDDNGVVTASGQATGISRIAQYLNLPAGTYTLSGASSGSSSGIGDLYISIVSSGTVIARDFDGSTQNTFTLSQTERLYVALRFSNGATSSSTTKVFYPQIERGETASEYNPYTRTSHTITLPETIYKGEVDVANGKGTKTFNAVDLGDLSYTYDSLNTRMVAVISDLKSTGTRRTSFVCSCFQTIDDGRELVNVPNNSVYSGGVGNTQVYIQTTDYTDPAAFKTAMVGQTLIYPIEDVSISLAPAKIQTLAGLNNIFSNTGDVSVEYFNENADQIAELIRVMTSSPETIAFALICPRTQTSNLQYEVYNHTITRNCKMSIQTSGLTDCGSNDAYLALLVNGVEIQRGTLLTDTTTSIDFSQVDVTQGDTVRLIFGWANNHGASFSGSGKMVLF